MFLYLSLMVHPVYFARKEKDLEDLVIFMLQKLDVCIIISGLFSLQLVRDQLSHELYYNVYIILIR